MINQKFLKNYSTITHMGAKKIKCPRNPILENDFQQISKDIPIGYTVFAFKNSLNVLTFLRGLVARTKSFAIASLLSWT